MPSRETQSARLSFRATTQNMAKLIAVAKAKAMTTAKGLPNVSAAMNFLIEEFDITTLARRKPKKKEKSDV